MHTLTLAQATQGLENGDFSSEEITRHYLNRIGQLDEHYNSYITVTADAAIEQARGADTERAKGNTGTLCGIPMAHKDLFCTEGVRTSSGSRMLDTFVPPYNATIVSHIKDAGAVVLGKTNMDEFAMGSSNETSWYGPVRNPWDIERVPGGSSGGSAAAIAAQLAVAATASDTGGSIRQPASLCGITGLKPTYGRVSRYGMIAFASSLDQAGTMTRTAEDAAILLGAMAGFDPLDSTSTDIAVPDYRATLNDDLSGLKIGIPDEYFSEGLHPGTAAAVENAIKELEKLGATTRRISLPHSNLAVPCYYVLAPAEASANLSRFDGVRYGHRCEDPEDLYDLYTRSREEGFGDEVKRRILIGAYVLSAGFYDAYYRKAQRIRRLIKNDFIGAFYDVDVILGPTAPSPAFKLGEKTSDPVQMYLEDIYTIATNLAGLPAMSIPAGLAEGLPVGLQLIGQDFGEAKLLNIAHRFQQATDHHLACAPIIGGDL
ncbi:MAG: Asp-tRNA(Asn)/Glu-tRNA(Gln) amidotransferase subunit GatA [Pseudomonadales bacterium]